MTIIEYANLINEKIIIEYEPAQETFYSYFKHSVNKKQDSGTLVCGSGKSSIESLNDYTNKLAGEELDIMLCNYTKNYKVPKLEKLTEEGKVKCVSA